MLESEAPELDDGQVDEDSDKTETDSVTSDHGDREQVTQRLMGSVSGVADLVQSQPLQSQPRQSQRVARGRHRPYADVLSAPSDQILRRKPPTRRKLEEDPYYYYCVHCGDRLLQSISYKGKGVVEHHQMYHADCTWKSATCMRKEPMRQRYYTGAAGESDHPEDDAEADGIDDHGDSAVRLPPTLLTRACSLPLVIPQCRPLHLPLRTATTSEPLPFLPN